MVQELFIELVVVALKVLAGAVLSAGALYSAISALDRLTQGIDEWKELKKGNMAIGLLLVSVMASVFILVEPRIVEFVYFITADLPILLTLQLLALSLLNYILALLGAVFLVFLTINLIDRITHDIDEFSELKKGNAAVALVFAAAVLLVFFSLQGPVEYAFDALKLAESALL